MKCHSQWRNLSRVSVLHYGKTSPIYSLLPFISSNQRQLHISPVLCKVIPFNLSDIGEGITEVTVKEWFVKVGDKVSQFENICEVQSDKASVTITSRFDGIITKLHYEVDEMARVGHPLVDIDASEESEELEPKPQARQFETMDTSEESAQMKKLATPAVRRIASEYKVDLSVVPGTGKSGRVMKEDILAFISGSPLQQTKVTEFPSKSSVTVKKFDADRIENISGYSKTMVKTMTIANAVPHVVYGDEVNVGPLIELRKQSKTTAEKLNIKLTYMPFFIKAASLALSEFPILNASVNDDCTQIIYKSHHNIGMAMDTPNGLVVPNVKNVQALRLFDIAVEINRIMQAGLRGAFAPSDVTGGTFSISNIGSIGGTYMKPVLLPPELTIGAFGRFQKLPRFNEKGELLEANVMCISWAADHRVIDGATVARFSNMFKELIENPIHLLIE